MPLRFVLVSTVAATMCLVVPLRCRWLTWPRWLALKFLLRATTPLAPTQQPLPRAPTQQPVLVMSLGSVCLTARTLGLAGARTFAAPFDWIFSNPAIVAHVIADRGATLLDPSCYIRLADKVGHSMYSAMLVPGAKGQNAKGVIFNHHDPIGSAADLAYLTRAMRRLDAALGCALPKRCVLISLEKRQPLCDFDFDGCDNPRSLLAVLAEHSHPDATLELIAIKLYTPPYHHQASCAAASSATDTAASSATDTAATTTTATATTAATAMKLKRP